MSAKNVKVFVKPLLYLLFPKENLRLHLLLVLLHVKIGFPHIFPTINQSIRSLPQVSLTNRLELSLRIVFALPKAFENKPNHQIKYFND